MVLQDQGRIAVGGVFGGADPGRSTEQGHVMLDEDAVVQEGHSGP